MRLPDCLKIPLNPPKSPFRKGGLQRSVPLYSLPAISESAYGPAAAGNPDFLQTIKKVEDQ